ncbi:MmcQ/YjbR family DNA-binding protein [Bifidobacterium pseudolongum]|uniref:MmcQ/YjbR family DNA-binding protein n=1 Tax=Bifidobacterium pseudolongum TaxID=1694 RepID=UPI0010215590
MAGIPGIRCLPPPFARRQRQMVRIPRQCRVRADRRKANNPNEETFVAVVKVDPELINELSTQPGYARGYHMNKEHWLTVLLDGSVSFTDVCKHIDSSFQLTSD